MAVVYINPNAAPGGSGASLVDALDEWPTTGWTAGNQYVQLAGTTYTGSIAPNASGSSGSRILIGVCDHSGAVVFNGSAVAYVNSGVDQDCINLARSGSRSYFDVIGLSLTQGGRSGATKYHCIHARAALETTTRSIYVQHVEMQGSGGAAMTGRGVDYRILNCDIHDFDDDGLKLETANTEVAHCRIYRPIAIESGGDADSDCIEIKSQAGNDLGWAWVHHCYLENLQVGNAKQVVIFQDATQTEGSGRFVLEKCELIGGGGASIYTNMGGTVIRRNTVTTLSPVISVRGTGHLMTANVIAQCKFVTQLNESSASLTVRNNTIIQAKERLVSIGSAVTGSTVVYRNNVALSIGTGDAADRLHSIPAGNTLTAGGNAYSGTLPATNYLGTLYDTIAEYQAASSQDAGAFTGDLQATTTGRPLPGSPLLTGGADLGYIRDIRGFQSRKHIGAYGPARLRVA